MSDKQHKHYFKGPSCKSWNGSAWCHFDVICISVSCSILAPVCVHCSWLCILYIFSVVIYSTIIEVIILISIAQQFDLMLSEDGSGRGAALVAAVATRIASLAASKR